MNTRGPRQQLQHRDPQQRREPRQESQQRKMFTFHLLKPQRSPTFIFHQPSQLRIIIQRLKIQLTKYDHLLV